MLGFCLYYQLHRRTAANRAITAQANGFNLSLTKPVDELGRARRRHASDIARSSALSRCPNSCIAKGPRRIIVRDSGHENSAFFLTLRAAAWFTSPLA